MYAFASSGNASIAATRRGVRSGNDVLHMAIRLLYVRLCGSRFYVSHQLIVGADYRWGVSFQPYPRNRVGGALPYFRNNLLMNIQKKNMGARSRFRAFARSGLRVTPIFLSRGVVLITTSIR